MDESEPEEEEPASVAGAALGAGMVESSSARAEESGARMRSSSSMTAATMGLERSTSFCSWLSVLPAATDSSICEMRFCFLRSARRRFVTTESTGPSLASEAAAAAAATEPEAEAVGEAAMA